MMVRHLEHTRPVARSITPPFHASFRKLNKTPPQGRLAVHRTGNDPRNHLQVAFAVVGPELSYLLALRAGKTGRSCTRLAWKWCQRRPMPRLQSLLLSRPTPESCFGITAWPARCFVPAMS